MKLHLLGLSAGFALLLGACNSDNNAAVTTTREDNSVSGDTAVVTQTGPDAEDLYRRRARRIADRVTNDLKVKDTAVRTRFETAYYNRAKRYGTLRSQYQTDTTGQYQAMRQAEMETDKEVQTILTDRAMYTQYESHRNDYADQNYMDASDQMNSDGSHAAMGDDQNSAAGNQAMTNGTNGSTMNADGSTSANGTTTTASGTGSTMSTRNASGGATNPGDKTKVKIKAEDGSKIKIKNGDAKYKDEAGNKTKVNGD